MAPQITILPGIEHDVQTLEYWCGPACINIVLSYWDKQQAQADLWELIKTNTTIKVKPAGATPDEHTQHCVACDNNAYECWYTTPEAMATTINQFAAEATSATYETAPDAYRRIADSISAGSPVPAVFTTQPALHWTVAVGFQTDADVSGGVAWNGTKITGLYVRDPNRTYSGPGELHLKTVTSLPLMHTGPGCGPNPLRYPVVAKGTPPGPAPPRNLRVTMASNWRDFMKWAFRPWSKWFKPQQPPRRPPRPPRNGPPVAVTLDGPFRPS